MPEIVSRFCRLALTLAHGVCGNAIPYLVVIDGKGMMSRRFTGVVGASTILETVDFLTRRP